MDARKQENWEAMGRCVNEALELLNTDVAFAATNGKERGEMFRDFLLTGSLSTCCPVHEEALGEIEKRWNLVPKAKEERTPKGCFVG